MKKIDLIKLDILAGKPVIVVDDYDREFEGDIVISAEKVSKENLIFAMKHAKGLMCLPCTQERIDRLDIPMMRTNKMDKFGTPFTVSIDAVEGTSTGMSVYDRLKTIGVFLSKESKPNELAQPGHLFPLRAQPGLLKDRRGHTEASIELMRYCGLEDVAVIIEIMNDDGTMTKGDQLTQYSKIYNLTIISVEEIYEAVIMEFNSRAYNDLSIDPETQSILIKKSKEKRLSDEIEYYKNLPKELQVFFPRLIDSKIDNDLIEMKLEYYGYDNLGKISTSFFSWNTIFDFIGKYIDLYLVKTKMPSNDLDYRLMYISKTENEYNKLITEFKIFNILSYFDEYEVKINNGLPKILLNFKTIWPTIQNYILNNFKPDSYHYIHGDMCFSNILYNFHNDNLILKFIDPRGTFGNTKFYGDFYYDLAKLSHSCKGQYESIINDDFKVKVYNNKLSLNHFKNNPFAAMDFDDFCKKRNYDMLKIKTLEGIIFIGMIARHFDNSERQKAMFITGLNLLNEVYEELNGKTSN